MTRSCYSIVSTWRSAIGVIFAFYGALRHALVFVWREPNVCRLLPSPFVISCSSLEVIKLYKRAGNLKEGIYSLKSFGMQTKSIGNSAVILILTQAFLWHHKQFLKPFFKTLLNFYLEIPSVPWIYTGSFIIILFEFCLTKNEKSLITEKWWDEAAAGGSFAYFHLYWYLFFILFFYLLIS